MLTDDRNVTDNSLEKQVINFRPTKRRLISVPVVSARMCVIACSDQLCCLALTKIIEYLAYQNNINCF